MIENILSLIWVVCSIILAMIFATAAIMSVVLSVKRRRLAFLGLTACFILFVTVLALANPIVNMVVFHKLAARNTNNLIAEMRSQCPIGHSTENFIAKFGNPYRVRKSSEWEIWTYDANPWWMIGWTEIEINIVSNTINGHWLED